MSKITRNIVVLGVLIALLAIAAYFIFFTKLGFRLTHSNVGELSDYLQSFGSFAVILGAFAVLLQTWFPVVPFVIVAGTNVLVFGLWWGFAINYSMSCVGAITAFLFARYYAGDWVRRKSAQNLTLYKFNKIAEDHGFSYIFMARLIPVLPSSAINLGSAVSHVPIRYFVFATLLGKLPIVLLESLIGHDLLFFKQYKARLIGLALVFLLLLGVGMFIKSSILRRDT